MWAAHLAIVRGRGVPRTHYYLIIVSTDNSCYQEVSLGASLLYLFRVYCFFSLHFPDEEIESGHGEMTCLRSHVKLPDTRSL